MVYSCGGANSISTKTSMCRPCVYASLHDTICKKIQKKLFLIAIDFNEAFDRVPCSLLIWKLCKFGAGTIFTACVASIYMSTDNVIFREFKYITYKLFSEIKQGLPLSPLLFLFYINDIFDFFASLHVWKTWIWSASSTDTC